jgi:murein L,D-transpeptidase YcbB/YkuD
MSGRTGAIALLAALASVVAWSGSAASDPGLDPVAQILYERVSHLPESERLEVRGAPIASTIVLPDFYTRRQFTAAWTDQDEVTDLVQAIRDAEQDGLDPGDYHLSAIEAARSAMAASSDSPPPALAADLDLLATDALIRLTYHLLFGKVDIERLDSNWNMSRELRDGADPARWMQEAIDSGSLRQRIDDLKPKNPLYVGLKAALARQRAIAATGGYATVREGPPLKPGMEDERAPALRQRLFVTGELGPGSASSVSSVYDDSLAAAVARFQTTHGLTADSVAGPATLAAINVPVAARIDQIRVNLERCRWVMHDLPERFVVTNIAAFEVFYFERGPDPVWMARCQVGKEARKTPIFKAEIKYVELNPTWTVPPTILAKDTLPAIRRDPGYLSKRHIRVINAAGREVPASSINWQATSARNFPYMLRQDPGPHCALGRVKFVSPNSHAVYLHDTPSKELFERTDRAFSSGCIRVERPLELAERLIADPDKWSREAIDTVVQSVKTTPIPLPEPVLVYFLYFTAMADRAGNVRFFPDLYGQDPRVRAALAAPFAFRQRPILHSPAGSGARLDRADTAP